jgi:anaerobic selenocysteine-containing dehydrogenase
MKKVRPDKENPRSEGYACRKGLNVIYHQYPRERLTEPLKRAGDRFEPISWDRAIDEIASRTLELKERHGPRALAYMGGSAPGGQFEAAFGLTMIRSLGSQYYYSSAGQEFSGLFWVLGRMFGKQYNMVIPDQHASENGMESHQEPQAPRVLKRFSEDPERILVVVDPRKSETAAMANIHLAVRPGADALLMKAMISIILEEGWEAKEYIREHVEGWDRIRAWFKGFDVRAALEVCMLEYAAVHELCRLMSTRRWCFHPDLGIYMGRHSTLNSYLMNILGAVCGIFCVRGGNVIPGMVMPLGFHADERNPKTWRTVTTGLPPAAAGSFPPAVVPEEILSDHPERLRAVFVSGCNPLRSYPDTSAYEKGFARLDLLVVNDIVMSETARLAHYVLPCRTFYESWDGSFFPLTFPKVYFQMRRPIVPPPGKCLEAAQIFTLLADRMGLIPEIPDEFQKAAEGNRLAFGANLMKWASGVEGSFSKMPYVLAKTLGRVWDSAALAALWGMLMTAPEAFRRNAARVGFKPGMDQGDRIFQAVLDNPQGMWVGEVGPEEILSAVKTSSGKVEVHIPEMEEGVRKLDARSEAEALRMTDEFPHILSAGRHMKYNANTLMRNPEWNQGKRACTIAVSPQDAEGLSLRDGQRVRVVTEAGEAEGELQVTDQVRQGTVLIPHGFGLVTGGEEYGINVNRLTRSTHRDPIGTPLHRFVPCRIEPVGS